jgi:hypothetical protein
MKYLLQKMGYSNKHVWSQQVTGTVALVTADKCGDVAMSQELNILWCTGPLKKLHVLLVASCK